MRSLFNHSYILWLIRQGHATTWTELCEHFSIDPDRGFSAFPIFFGALKKLVAAGLITTKPAVSVFEGFVFLPFLHAESHAELTFAVTPMLSKVQDALQLSLTELSSTDPDDRMIITPALRRVPSTRYQNQLLVLMPFAEELRPLYADHLKAVAERMKLTIARADDFFTAEHVVEEIWSAIALSEIVIADCTGRNPNVFYEIGLAHAIGVPVILITRSSDDVPFDLRQRRYIHYEFTPRGMKAFEEVLKETIETIRADPETFRTINSRRHSAAFRPHPL
jgi:hypothetical protein